MWVIRVGGVTDVPASFHVLQEIYQASSEKCTLKKAPFGHRKETSSHTKKSGCAVLLKATLTAECWGGASRVIMSRLGSAIAYEEVAKDIDE